MVERLAELLPTETLTRSYRAGGEDLAELLATISLEAANLSDRLAMRFFTHVGDVGRQTLAA